MRLTMVFVAIVSATLAGCVLTKEQEAAELARQSAEDDQLCRLAGFPRGSEQYRYCRKERILTR